MRLAVSAKSNLVVVLIGLAVASNVDTASANHGPGTSGGASYTISGETIRKGGFDISVREDFTRFEDIDRQTAERLAIKSGEFDGLDYASITSASVTYGITDDLQVGAQLGYYAANDFIDAESEDGESAESSTADPEGLTDLAISLKYRVMKGRPGNLSLIAGLIAPTGRDDVKLSGGEFLEPSSQPGTGAWGYQAGLAYSRFLTSRVTTDVSTVYTLRTEHDGFTVGDRADFGVALAYRFTESVKSFPNFSVFSELNTIWLGKDDESDEGKNDNSGGWTTYFTPGARVRFSPNVMLTVAPSVPIIQDLNGEQIEASFKLSAVLSLTF
jgi:hypothetical protein